MPFDADEAFTEGPWKWHEDLYPLHMRRLGPGILMLDNDHGCGGPWGDEIDRANAHLIAAAPSLYATLKATRALVSEGAISGFSDPTWQDALFRNQRALTAALALARGEGEE